ncbi:hypothetical protein [Zunongwangia pacifica]|uniref:Uncharacterized protein n=1 Tax=Zunongwangia pacifica TaxID=2911062 RepID=A0A9X1ZRQ9_9FLAO|nr:hypothetical protein [Zunongwangia pacifica]MCL6218826.1 hypothetical protein [Zunongwangia pacifica]
MKKITKRDVKFALLGFFSFFVINLILNSEAFIEGYNEGKAYFETNE